MAKRSQRKSLMPSASQPNHIQQAGEMGN